MQLRALSPKKEGSLCICHGFARYEFNVNKGTYLTVHNYYEMAKEKLLEYPGAV